MVKVRRLKLGYHPGLAKPPAARHYLRPSTPMKVGLAARTPKQWLDFVRRHPDQAGAKPARVYLSRAKMAELIRVKGEVAKAHPYRPDPAGNDFWRLLKGRQLGDCEDIALTIRELLAALGWSMGALRPAICRTTLGRGHAVLCVHTTAGVYVVDNLIPHVAPWAGLLHSWICRLDGDRWRLILPKPK